MGCRLGTDGGADGTVQALPPPDERDDGEEGRGPHGTPAPVSRCAGWSILLEAVKARRMYHHGLGQTGSPAEELLSGAPAGFPVPADPLRRSWAGRVPGRMQISAAWDV